MKFKRRFYDSTIDFRAISKERLILGVVVGLASAFFIYSFSYVMRETYRVISFSFENFPNKISDFNRNFYNLFFASLSIIFGNSIAINFILSKPQNIFSRHNLKRSRILNDQIFLNFNFAHWFMKLGLVMGAFSMCCMDFQFLPYFYLPFILLVIVMYLDTWKALIQVLGIKGYKWMLFHFLLLGCLTFGLSRINTIDYNAIDEIAIRQNPIIDLPMSDFYNSESEKRDFVINFKLSMNEHDKLVIVSGYGEQISLEEVSNEISVERNSRREELIPFISVRISAEKNLGLIYIKQFEAELYKLNQRKIIYDVYNEDVYTKRFEKRGILKRISENVLEFRINKEIPLPPRPDEFYLPENFFSGDTLKILIADDIKIDGLVIPKEMLKRKFKNYINQNTLFEYNFSTHTKYQDYITVLSAHFEAAYELRKQKQTVFKENEYDYNEAYKIEQEQLKVEFPIMIIEKLN